MDQNIREQSSHRMRAKIGSVRWVTVAIMLPVFVLVVAKTTIEFKQSDGDLWALANVFLLPIFLAWAVYANRLNDLLQDFDWIAKSGFRQSLVEDMMQFLPFAMAASVLSADFE